MKLPLRPTREHVVVVSVVALGLTVAVLGFASLRWQCDDAFIAFRYAAQSRAGQGYVWNAAPFVPVEGYTSFLWVFLLRWWWTLTGVTPPEAADGFSLLFGLGTLIVAARWAWRLELGDLSLRVRASVLGLVVLGTAVNRTYLTWLSSGLETALFNFLWILWLYECAKGATPRTSASVARLAAYAALAALARPDGLLCVAGTLVVAAVAAWKDVPRSWQWFRALAPLSLVLAHLAWRHATYGEWLPNTYFAKATAPWPEMGRVYLASFALEHGLFLWVLVAAAGAIEHSLRGERVIASWRPRLGLVVAAGILLFHLGFYVLRIGGDHFEYRVVSHSIPLLFLIAARIAFFVRVPDLARLGLLLACVVITVPIPLAHHLATKDIRSRDEYDARIRDIAPRLPGWLRPWTEAFDRRQEEALSHGNGVRRHDHMLFLEEQRRTFAATEAHRLLGVGSRYVITVTGAGWPGWVFPNAALIDTFGLSDRVVARNPELRQPRYLAHERQPPPGYVECFRPQAHARNGAFERVVPAPAPLTDTEVRACESRSWQPHLPARR